MGVGADRSPLGSIRRLGASDLTAMRALNTVFGHVFDDVRTYAEDPPPDDALRLWLGQPHHIVLVCEIDGQVIGGLVAYVLDKFEQMRSEIYIYDLGVDQAWRRQGVATRLIHRLQTMAGALGSWVVFVQADLDDPPAIALYEKLGVREDVLHFDLPPKGCSTS